MGAYGYVSIIGTVTGLDDGASVTINDDDGSYLGMSSVWNGQFTASFSLCVGQHTVTITANGTNTVTGNSGSASTSLPVVVPPKPSLKFPGDIPLNQSPGSGFEWKGKPGSQPGDGDGTWYNKDTDESLWNDMKHEPPIGPHWDYFPPKPGRGKWRWFPDGHLEEAK